MRSARFIAMAAVACAVGLASASTAVAATGTTDAAPRVVGATCSSPALHQARLAVAPAAMSCAGSAGSTAASAPSVGCQVVTVGCESWMSTPLHGAANRTDDAPGNFTSASVMATSPDGRTVYLGATTDDGGTTAHPHLDLTTLAYDATGGATLWTQTYPGALSPLGGEVNSVVADAGGVYTTGDLEDPSTFAYSGAVTIAYDATGNRRWVVDDAANGMLAATDSALSPDGTVVYVAEGGADPVTHTPEAIVAAYATSDGRQLWRAATPHAGASRIVVSADGRHVYATDAITGSDGFTTAIDVVGYDTATRVQTMSFTQPIHGFWGAPIVVSHDGGRIFVEAQTYDGNENGGLTIALDPTGTVLWRAQVGGQSCPGAQNQCFNFNAWYFQPLVVSPDGSRVFVSGFNAGVVYLPQSGHLPTDSTESGFETIAFDAASGTREWTDQSSTSFGFCLGCGPVVTVSPDGAQVFVTGTNTLPELIFVDTFAYDAATGAQRWSSVLDATPDTASAVAVSPAGDRVYVGAAVEPTDGQSPNGYGVVAVGYSTTGGVALPVALPEAPMAALLFASGAAAVAATEVRRRSSRRARRKS